MRFIARIECLTNPGRGRCRSTAALALVFIWPLMGCTALGERYGPLPVRNMHPAQMSVQVMAPTDTRRLAPGEGRARLQTAYASVFLADSGGTGTRVDFDMEISRTALAGEFGVGRGLRLRTELPVAHTTGGFLDDFVTDFHRALSLSDQGRSLVEDDRFLGIAEFDGDRVLDMEQRDLTLLDVPLELSWIPREAGVDGALGFGLRAGLELPTGDADAGYGNDEVDFGAGVFVEWRPGDGRVAWTAHAEHTFAGTPDRSRGFGFDYEDVTSGGVGVEVGLSGRWSAILQLEAESSTLRGLGPPQTGLVQSNLWTGLRWRAVDRGFVELAFAEDAFAYSSADFTAWLAFGASWGGRTD